MFSSDEFIVQFTRSSDNKQLDFVRSLNNRRKAPRAHFPFDHLKLSLQQSDHQQFLRLSLRIPAAVEQIPADAYLQNLSEEDLYLLPSAELQARLGRNDITEVWQKLSDDTLMLLSLKPAIAIYEKALALVSSNDSYQLANDTGLFPVLRQLGATEDSHLPHALSIMSSRSRQELPMLADATSDTIITIMADTEHYHPFALLRFVNDLRGDYQFVERTPLARQVLTQADKGGLAIFEEQVVNWSGAMLAELLRETREIFPGELRQLLHTYFDPATAVGIETVLPPVAYGIRHKESW